VSISPPAIRILALALAAAPVPAVAVGGILFHPLIADPREDQIRVQIASFTQDYRYGTDVTDSTTVAGVDAGRRGTEFEVGVGHTFRGPELERMLGWRGPWERWQFGIPAGIFTTFQRVDAQLINAVDYQFGLSIDTRWHGDPAREDAGALVESRLVLYHRSSHLADEYVTLSRFGRNQEGIDGSVLSAFPPIKRVEVSYEALRGIVSVEWNAFPVSPSTVRFYGGGEIKVPISRREPHRMRSPSGQVGVEFHSAGRREPSAASWLESVGRLFGAERLGASWFAAADLRVSRAFEFSGCDNPFGDDEVLTPRLFSTCPYGSEREYAGSWHGMFGARFAPAVPASASAVMLSLDWYRGYSPYGPFQDQRFQYHPRWFFVPTLTLQLW
jgi:hypothetical protein